VIAVIDDDESVRIAMASLLRSLGMAALTFAGAEEFLRSPRLGDAACAIADVQMPGTGGLELQERLIALGHRLPMIFVTAYPDERVRARALAAGAVCFLGKPFAAQELTDCIDAALRGAPQP
jgi:FixJ family two-component response regulator